MSPKNVRQQCDDKSFFSMVIKEEYSADRMKSRVVGSIAISFLSDRFLKIVLYYI